MVLNTAGTERSPLYAALDTATGRVHDKTAAPDTSRYFVASLEEVVSLCPPHQQIHIILDNPSAHKAALVHVFVEQNPRVRFHSRRIRSNDLSAIGHEGVSALSECFDDKAKPRKRTSSFRSGRCGGSLSTSCSSAYRRCASCRTAWADRATCIHARPHTTARLVVEGSAGSRCHTSPDSCP
jgi:hypothetical protein